LVKNKWYHDNSRCVAIDSSSDSEKDCNTW
jgi:hypothetical protein